MNLQSIQTLSAPSTGDNGMKTLPEYLHKSIIRNLVVLVMMNLNCQIIGSPKHHGKGCLSVFVKDYVFQIS